VTDLRHLLGPFDIIGDVHGCFDELEELLGQLGYEIDRSTVGTVGVPDYVVRHPDDRTIVFLGDLVDRGPKIVSVLRLAMAAVAQGVALCVPGNRDVELLRKLSGRAVKVTRGLAGTLTQLDEEPAIFRESVEAFLAGLPSHYVLDGGKLVVAHAGLPAELQGSDSPRAREFASFGEPETPATEAEHPPRRGWASAYAGSVLVVYGHVPVAQPAWLNRTIDIDTGCVYGGKLTALRYPELELPQVSAKHSYNRPPRPFAPS
jgi:protein phosphatase